MSWKENVRNVVPYVPGEQPKIDGLIKLNSNENPYPPSPLVQEALRALDAGLLRKYPEPDAGELVRAMSAYHHVSPDQVFVGVGSDDVLAMSFLTFFNSPKPVLFPDITYSFYDVWAKLFRIPYEEKPLDEHFCIRAWDYFGENGGIVLANPNAPTGLALGLDVIEEIVARNSDSVVIVDEAYVDFGWSSALPLIDRYENLLVVRTFSKSRSMAGMRIGAAFGSRELIRRLNDVKFSFNSFTMNLPSIKAGVAALGDEAYFKKTVGRIIATREQAKEDLRRFGFSFGDSQTNFLFVTHPRIHARELFTALREEKILVRYFNKPRIDEYLRITVGTDEEMAALTDFLKRYETKVL